VIDAVIGDDHAVFVDALTTVLALRRIRVRAVARRAGEVVTVVRRHRPAVCLLDRSFPDGDGLDLVPVLLETAPATRVLLVSADADDATARRAVERGAHGYVHKTQGIDVLVDGIRRVAEGGTVMALPPPAAVRRPPEDDHAHWLAGHLTPREQETLSLLVQGAGTADIARRLGISVTTVRTHVQAVMTKLGVHTRLEAAAVAARHGLVSFSA
jgi:DNA-binding NarL/FixJ family response regulator